MTFDSAAYAINGPEIGAAIARRAIYASSRQSGIVQKNDLKVSALAVPGIGIQIAEGVGITLNDYQTDPNEVYVVNNPGVHTVASSDMPAANPSAKSYIVAIVVGDVDFNQAGHPWMPSTLAPEDVEDFVYVRPTLIEVASSSVKTLDVPYPALVLARIDVPASTTTITNAMITDLRKLAAPRQSQQIFVGQPWTNASPRRIPAGSAYADWGPQEYSPSVQVPEWADRAIVICSINGVRLTDSSANVAGNIRTQLGSVTGDSIAFDIPNSSTGAVRMNLQTAGEYDVSGISGSQALRVEGYENAPASPTTNQKLALQSGSQMIFDVRFFEE